MPFEILDVKVLDWSDQETSGRPFRRLHAALRQRGAISCGDLARLAGECGMETRLSAKNLSLSRGTVIVDLPTGDVDAMFSEEKVCFIAADLRRVADQVDAGEFTPP